MNRAAKVEIYGNEHRQFFIPLSTFLCIDIGNTRTKAGWFTEQGLQHLETVVDTPKLSTLKGWQHERPFDRCILSSVRNLNAGELDEISSKFDVVTVDASMPLPIRIQYETPETLGSDRICAAVGAHTRFPGDPTLSIDAGTCITYDLVVEGIYLGGAIAPGLQMRLNAMHHFTSRLPELKFSPERIKTGSSTSSSMQMGTGTAAALEMTGMIQHFTAEHPNLKVLLTGGDASFFEQHVENAIFAAPNLILEGLNAILRYHSHV